MNPMTALLAALSRLWRFVPAWEVAALVAVHAAGGADEPSGGQAA